MECRVSVFSLGCHSRLECGQTFPPSSSQTGIDFKGWSKLSEGVCRPSELYDAPDHFEPSAQNLMNQAWCCETQGSIDSPPSPCLYSHIVTVVGSPCRRESGVSTDLH